MKKLLFIISILTISYAARSQTGIFVGARGGLNIPKLTASGDNPMSKGYTSRLAGNGGIFVEFRFSELFSLQPMVEYTQQGGLRKGMQAIPPEMLPEDAQKAPAMVGEEFLYADFRSETTFDYLMVPVLAKFSHNLNNTTRVYVNAGPFASFLVAARHKTTGNSHLYVDPAGDMTLDYLLGTLTGAAPQGEISMKANRDIADDVYKLNYGISGNVGISREIVPRHHLLFEVGGNYGFRKIQKEAINGENRIGAITVVVGYAYKL